MKIVKETKILVLSDLEIPLDLSISCLDEKYELQENLEHMIIFHRNGLHIYSKNFSKDMNIVAEKNNLLTGFLSAITTFPLAIGYNNKDLKSLDIANSKLLFKYTNNDIIIVVAMKNDEKIHDIDFYTISFVLNEIQFYIEKEFRDENWELITNEIQEKFTNQISKTLTNYC